MPITCACHRVIATTGTLTGYSLGIQWKKILLEFDGVAVENDKARLFKPQ